MTRFSTAERLMQEALAIITGDRQEVYGPPEQNYRRIGLLWTAYLQANGIDGIITPVMSVQMHDLAKLSRLIQTPDHEDTHRDRFGYLGCNVALVLPAVSADEELRSDVWSHWPPAPVDYEGEDPADEDHLVYPEAAE